MVGKNYLFPKQILQDISTNIGSNPYKNESAAWYGIFPESFLLTYIYRKSIVPQKDFYKTCALISYKTSNSQSEIEQMPYYVFNNFVVFLNEIIEEENNGKSGENNSAAEQMAETQGMFKSQMHSMGKMMPNIGKSNFGKLK